LRKILIFSITVLFILPLKIINANLTEDMVLKYEKKFILENENKANCLSTMSILIATEKGKEFGIINFTEDKYCKIKDIRAVIKDTSGNILKNLDKKDIITSNFHFGATLHSDDNIKHFEFVYSILPYIIEIEYRIELNTLFPMPHYARWQPQMEIPVKQSSFCLIEKDEIPYRQFSQGIDVQPSIKTDGSKKISTWELTNIPPLKKRTFMPPEEREKMLLCFAPLSFTIDNTTGSFRTWEHFGRWYLQLIHNRNIDRLSEEVHKEISSLISNVNDPIVKIKLIYQYLQNNTRYVAIELGIGSWQPYTAEWVHENKFGDCKDLSNFMIALLKIADIKAYPVLIKTRNRGIVRSEFPYNDFNHVIVCVPLEADTVWLECTADHLVAGELDYYDEGCQVLLLDETCGKVVTTPQSSSKDNTWNSMLQGRLSRNGAMDFNSSIVTRGNDKQYFIQLIKETKPTEQELVLKKYLCDNFVIGQLNTYQFVQSPNDSKCLTINLSGKMENVGRIMGKRIFLNANIFNTVRNNSFDEKDSTRSILFDYPCTKNDSITITLPISYEVESKPKDITIECPYGMYYTYTIVSGNKLTYIRKYELRMRYIPEDRYRDFLAFYKKVSEADTRNFIFVKK
jgi:hypothetical protein